MANTPERVQFNWGYHDGAHDALLGRDRRNIPQGELFALPLWASAYRVGYLSGWDDMAAGVYDEDSSVPWTVYDRSGPRD